MSVELRLSKFDLMQAITNPMNVSFLIGSGASVPAGFPTVGEITQKIVSELPQADEKLWRWLEIQIKRRYVTGGTGAVHYENVYFLVKQIHDDLLDDYDNPAIRPFVESAIEQVLPSLPSRPGDAHDELRQLAEDVVRFIRQVVVSLLASHQPTRLDHLDFIVDAIQQHNDSLPGILTLNHDALLEKVLTEKKIPFVDGFEEQPNEVGLRAWQPSQPAGEAHVLRILKLHGGIDWFRFRPEGAEPWLEDYVAIPTPLYSPHRMDTLRRTHERLDDSLPMFMIGSWDKLSRYTDSVYLEIYYTAFEALRTADLLVVVGYGFGDKGINKLITDWMCRSSAHKLVVVDRDACGLWRYARGSIAGKWRDWLDNKNKRRLFPLSVDLKQTKISWASIMEKLK